jgi:hypothetical protein
MIVLALAAEKTTKEAAASAAFAAALRAAGGRGECMGPEPSCWRLCAMA